MARASSQFDMLVEIAEPDVKPSSTGAAHIGRDDASQEFVTIERPTDYGRTSCYSRPNKSTPGQGIDVELQSVFEPSASALIWHWAIPLLEAVRPH